MEINRLSYDSGHTELIYYVTMDSLPISTHDMVQLSTYLSIQDVALTLGEIIDDRHIIEPHSRSFQLHAGQQLSNLSCTV